MNEEPCTLDGDQDKKQSHGGQSRATSAEPPVETAAASLSFLRSTELTKTHHGPSWLIIIGQPQ